MPPPTDQQLHDEFGFEAGDVVQDAALRAAGHEEDCRYNPREIRFAQTEILKRVVEDDLRPELPQLIKVGWRDREVAGFGRNTAVLVFGQRKQNGFGG